MAIVEDKSGNTPLDLTVASKLHPLETKIDTIDTVVDAIKAAQVIEAAEVHAIAVKVGA